MAEAAFPSNSKKQKEEASKAPERQSRVERVVTGEVAQRKQPLGRRIAESFAGDDAKSVGLYVLMDVVIPTIKTMLYDSFTQGLERSLFGTSRPRTNTRAGSSNHTSYNKMYNNASRFDDREPRNFSNRDRATHNFDEIVIDSRAEAEEVLDKLGFVIEEYEVATVTDLYDLVGITGNYTDDVWGWTDLSSAQIRRVRGGYLIELPRPEALKP